jgi:hypothetical protein
MHDGRPDKKEKEENKIQTLILKIKTRRPCRPDAHKPVTNYGIFTNIAK